jgi:predicted RNA-binding protein YlxR (DUF448 family)
MPRKRVPLRTCVQCHEVRPKRELIRIVRTPEGAIEIDALGKAAGRGAYLCRSRACWQGAISGDRLDYALRVRLSPERKKGLLEYGEQLPSTAAEC